jgi:hypothetical protein
MEFEGIYAYHELGGGGGFPCKFPSEVEQLRVCYFVAPSLMRGRVCNLLYNWFWALPELSLLGRSPAELTSPIWDFWPEGQVPVFISLRNRVAQLYPRALGYMIWINNKL